MQIIFSPTCAEVYFGKHDLKNWGPHPHGHISTLVSFHRHLVICSSPTQPHFPSNLNTIYKHTLTKVAVPPKEPYPYPKFVVTPNTIKKKEEESHQLSTSAPFLFLNEIKSQAKFIPPSNCLPFLSLFLATEKTKGHPNEGPRCPDEFESWVGPKMVGSNLMNKCHV